MDTAGRDDARMPEPIFPVKGAGRSLSCSLSIPSGRAIPGGPLDARLVSLVAFVLAAAPGAFALARRLRRDGLGRRRARRGAQAPRGGAGDGCPYGLAPDAAELRRAANFELLGRAQHGREGERGPRG